MGMVVSNYDWMFNDVQFALDVKSARKRENISARALALAVGWQNETVIYAIERATYAQHLKLSHLIALCNLLNLHLPEYFEIEPATRVDLLRKLGEIAQG